MKHFVAAALLSITIASPSSAQRLVDPTKVAPEFREAAEKRRAEQIKQQDCAHKADAEKVIARTAPLFCFSAWNWTPGNSERPHQMRTARLRCR